MNFDPKPFIVPVFIPHSGCPHRCVFCNQDAVTGRKTAVPGQEEVRSEITRFLEFKRDNRRRTEISFFGGNFLGLDPETITDYLEIAHQFVKNGMANGIRFSTRPDTIDDYRLDLISGYPVTTVEIGVQSMDNHVLSLSARGHTAEDTVRAVGRLKSRQFAAGLQIMVGLPGDHRETTLATGKAVAGLDPDFVRIYPTLVIQGSRLAEWYAAGRYLPLEMSECIDRVKQLYRLFAEKKIPVIRIGLQANEGLDAGTDLVAGPYHPAMGELVLSEVLFEAATTRLESVTQPADTVILRVNPARVSAMRGQKNINLKRLSGKFSRIGRITVSPDPEVDRETVDFTLVN